MNKPPDLHRIIGLDILELLTISNECLKHVLFYGYVSVQYTNDRNRKPMRVSIRLGLQQVLVDPIPVCVIIPQNWDIARGWEISSKLLVEAVIEGMVLQFASK